VGVCKIYEICVLFVYVFLPSTLSPARFSLLMQLTLKVAYVCRYMHLGSESVLVTLIAVVLMHWEQCFVCESECGMIVRLSELQLESQNDIFIINPIIL
jgi:hypothetical protein